MQWKSAYQILVKIHSPNSHHCLQKLLKLQDQANIQCSAGHPAQACCFGGFMPRNFGRLIMIADPGGPGRPGHRHAPPAPRRCIAGLQERSIAEPASQRQSRAWLCMQSRQCFRIPSIQDRSTAWNRNSFFELPNFLRFGQISLNSHSQPNLSWLE